VLLPRIVSSGPSILEADLRVATQGEALLFAVEVVLPEPALGPGAGNCNRLAELQLKILWEEILLRFPRIEVVGAPQRTLSNFVRGFTHLPVVIPG